MTSRGLFPPQPSWDSMIKLYDMNNNGDFRVTHRPYSNMLPKQIKTKSSCCNHPTALSLLYGSFKEIIAERSLEVFIVIEP